MSQPTNNNNLKFWDNGIVFEIHVNDSASDENNLKFWDTGVTIEGFYSQEQANTSNFMLFMPF